GFGRKWLSADVWARTRRDTCSPIWNGIGSDKFLTSNPLLVDSSSHLERILLPERSNLFESHWSNQWLTNLSYCARGSAIRLLPTYSISRLELSPPRFC